MIFLLAWLYGLLFKEKRSGRDEEQIRVRLDEWKEIQRKRVP